MKHVSWILTMIALALVGIGAEAAVAQESLLYSFTSGSAGPGASGPGASLVSDASGNLYGTTQLGGTRGEGTAFELSPAMGGGWTEKVIYSFGQCPTEPCSGVSEPEGSLIFDGQGNLYGTTESGGPGGLYGGKGAVFELSPGAGGVWTETTLYEFGTNSGDGSNPVAALIFDAEGNLYGTTQSGGASGKGTVFELLRGTGGVWTEKVLYSFGGPAASPPDGQDPTGNLIFDGQGNLYGTTFTGGKNDTAGEGGTVFELSPGAGGVWTEKVLYNFGAAQSTDGNQPTAALIFDTEGNLYGTTREGGSSLDGTVFELSPGAGGTWTEALLHNFTGATGDGAAPYCTLYFDAQGNLYGTTKFGGPNNFAGTLDENYLGSGTVFELTPGGEDGWTENVLYSFNATGSDGTVPGASLIPDAAGNLYSTTIDGGSTGNANAIGDGSVFEIEAAGLPAFSPAGGKYAGTQSVKITSATEDAAIYYTTNGTTPTTSSTKYTGPVEVPETETIEAFATIAGSPNSAVASAAYTIQQQAAVLTSPAADSRFSGRSVTFVWTATGATSYDLWLGSTGVGSNNLWGSGATTATSVTFGNMPTNGETIYVRLYTTFAGLTLHNDYTFTAAALAVLTSPTSGGTLPGPKVTFAWSAGTGASAYGIWLGTSGVGSNNLWGSGATAATSVTFGNMPTNGETIYLRLFTTLPGVTLYNDYAFTAAAQAVLTSPTSGSTLPGPKVTFTWSAGSGTPTYGLWLGTSGVGSNNLWGSGATTATSVTFGGIPTNGEKIYVRLFTTLGGVSVHLDYTFTAATQAVMTSPAQGSTFPGRSVTFTWSAGSGTPAYGLWLGTSGVGSNNLWSSGATTATSVTFGAMPTNGETIYARLFTTLGGVTVHSDYTYIAAE